MVRSAAVLLLLLCAMPCMAAEGDGAAARAVIEKGRDEMLAALRNPELSKAEKGKRVADVCAGRIDFETLAKLALGPVWKEITPEQQREFMKEFRQHALSVCSGSTERYGGEDVTVIGDKAEARGDHTVNTKITRIKEGTLRDVAKVDFRLRKNQEKWEVIDVLIHGISMAGSFRAQFTAIMKDGGFEKLMQLLREKNAANQAASGEGATPAK